MKLLILNGPNLNLLGKREPQIYGHETYDDLVDYCGLCGMEFGVELEVLQSNHEGILIDLLQDAEDEGFAGVVLNAAGYTHTSIALMDTIKAISIPVVEVHLSNIMEREEFRHISYIGKACVASFMGEGFAGYRRAIEFLVGDRRPESSLN